MSLQVTSADPTLVCPKCGGIIKLTESLAAPLIAATRAQYEKQLASQATAFAAEKLTVEKEQRDNRLRAAELKTAAKFQEQKVAQAVAQQLLRERAEIAKQAESRARECVEGELQAKQEALDQLKERAENLNKKLTLAQAAEAELMKKEQKLRDRERELELDMQKGIAAGLELARSQARREEQDESSSQCKIKRTRLQTSNRRLRICREKPSRGHRKRTEKRWSLFWSTNYALDSPST